VNDKLIPIISKAEQRKIADDYVSQMRNKMENDEKMLSKLNDKEKKKILDALTDLEKFLQNKEATKDQIKNKLKQTQDIVDPLVDKAEAQANLLEYVSNLKKRVNNENDVLSKLPKKEKKSN